MTLDLVALCNRFGWRPDAVCRELRGLEWDVGPRRTGVTISQHPQQQQQKATWFWVDRGAAGHIQLDDELAYLRRRLDEIERVGLGSLAQLQAAVALVAVPSVDDIVFVGDAEGGDATKARSQALHARIEADFNTAQSESVPCVSRWPPKITSDQVRRRSFLNEFKIYCFTEPQMTIYFSRKYEYMFTGISTWIKGSCLRLQIASEFYFPFVSDKNLPVGDEQLSWSAPLGAAFRGVVRTCHIQGRRSAKLVAKGSSLL